jgi:hypothetical protein
MNEQYNKAAREFAFWLVRGDAIGLSSFGIDVRELGKIGTPEYYQRAIETLAYCAALTEDEYQYLTRERASALIRPASSLGE